MREPVKPIKVPSKTDYIQPAGMAFASLLNMVGSVSAMIVGADKVNDRINPFFYIAFSTSCLYFASNVFRMGQIRQQHNKTFAKIELERRELKEVVIDSCERN